MTWLRLLDAQSLNSVQAILRNFTLHTMSIMTLRRVGVCVQRTDKSIKCLLVFLSINVWHTIKWPWVPKGHLSSWTMFDPMTSFMKIVVAHVSEGMCWNIKGFFKYCFQRRMSPNGSFNFFNYPLFNQSIFSYIFNYLNSESIKLCWEFSVAKQVDAQWLGMWICAFSALCTCFCVQRSFNAVTAQMAHFPWLQTPGGRRMSRWLSTQEHCCHYMDLNETSVS